MSEQQPDPTAKELRDARRHAHGVQKHSKPEAGGDKKDRKGLRDKKGRKGKGDPKP